MRSFQRYAAAIAALLLTGFVGIGLSNAQTITTLDAKPLAQADALKGATLKPVHPGTLLVPTITWGGDVATVFTNSEGAFKSEGLSVSLFHEDDFAKQVRGVLDGKTPLLRGTFGMINSAAELFHKNGTDLVVVHQLTWSRGGDALVVRPGIKSLSDLKGKTIALQLYGPHMDLLTTVLNRAGLKISDVNIRWFKELTVPAYDTQGQIVDPRSAFAADPTIDAAFVISPDAAVLADPQKGVNGASVLFSTRSADHVIADVYAVRKDWFDAHRDEALKFEHALMVGQEQFQALVSDKGSQKRKYDRLLKDSANLLMGSDQATADVEGLLGDCEFVGFTGNVAFFTGAGTTRNFDVLKDEIQKSFTGLRLISGPAPLATAGWDYAQLASGLKHADLTIVPRQTFDAEKVYSSVQRQISANGAQWDQDGTLYSFEIHFLPDQAVFSQSVAEYAQAFQKVLELSQTFGGAILTIEGYVNPSQLTDAQDRGDYRTAAALQVSMQRLSENRAKAVLDAYMKFAKGKQIAVDTSQLVVVGRGATGAKYPRPNGEPQAAQNRRVIFRIKNVESEASEFEPTK